MLSGATRRIYNWCPLCGYKVRKNRKPSRLHHNICSNRSFEPFGWCRVCYQEHQLDPFIVASSEFCFKTSSEHLSTSRQTLEGIQQPACDVSFPEGNNSFQDDDDIISTEDQEETIQFESISGKTYSILKTMNKEGLLLDQSKHIPLPSYSLSIPSRETLAMEPIELELILFINKHFLPPSYLDHIMNWAFKARDDGYFQKKQHAPSHQTLKKIEYIIYSISYRVEVVGKTMGN